MIFPILGMVYDKVILRMKAVRMKATRILFWKKDNAEVLHKESVYKNQIKRVFAQYDDYNESYLTYDDKKLREGFTKPNIFKDRPNFKYASERSAEIDYWALHNILSL
jgi:hypothetical protein